MFINDGAGLNLPDTPYDHDLIMFAEPRPQRASFRIQRLGTYFVSNLFTAEYMAAAKFVHEKQLVTLCRGKELFFTGERFSQWDLDVMLHCVLNTPRREISDGQFRLNPVELLHSLNMRNSLANRQRVFESLHRLHTGVLDIRGRDYQYMTRLMNRVLVDSRRTMCLVEINEDVAACFKHSGVPSQMHCRRQLGRNGLAKWIHGATMVFKGGFTAQMSSLYDMCHTTARQKRNFPAALGKALALMEDSGCIKHWEIRGSRVWITAGSNREHQDTCGMIYPAVCS